MVAKTWPDDLKPVSAEWWIDFGTGSSRSRSGAVRSVDFGAHLWRCILHFDRQSEAKAQRIMALVASLTGDIEPIDLFPSWYRRPRGNLPAGAVASVAQGGIIGKNLPIAGLTGTNPVLRAGDLGMSFTAEAGRRMYIIDEDVNHSGGDATLKVSPPVTVPHSNGAVFTMQGIESGPNRVYVSMMMADAEQARRSCSRAIFNAFDLEFVEWWPP